MRPRLYESRQTANSAAKRLRPNAADRLVLACEDCPKTSRSKRRRPSRSADAKFLAQRLGVEPQRVRAALEELAEARRNAPANGSAPTLPLVDGEG